LRIEAVSKVKEQILRLIHSMIGVRVKSELFKLQAVARNTFQTYQLKQTGYRKSKNRCFSGTKRWIAADNSAMAPAIDIIRVPRSSQDMMYEEILYLQ
jgi:hypothetical protein